MARPTRRRRVFESPPALGSQLMGLSLFIMLLAFFIVLNGISSFQDHKVRPAIQSIGAAFGIDMQAFLEDEEPLRPSPIDDPAEAGGVGGSLDQIEALFTTRIAGVQVQRDTARDVMRIRLPVQVFAQALVLLTQEPSPRPSRTTNQSLPPLMPTLVSLLRSEARETAYRMDIVLTIAGTPGRMQNESPQTLAAHVRRVSGFGASLESAGVPARLISTGLAPAQSEEDSEMVDLFFRPHTPYSPLDTPPISVPEGSPAP